VRRLCVQAFVADRRISNHRTGFPDLWSFDWTHSQTLCLRLLDM